jgi:hypothetical protein
MGAYRHQATWRQTTFNEGYADGGQAPDDPAVIVDAKLNDQITIDELNLQRVSAQDYRELRQYLEGAEPNEAYEGVRAITGSGIIAATNLSTLEDKAWILNEQFSTAACRLAFAGLDPKGVGPFDFKRDTAAIGQTKALRFYARPGPARPVWIGRRGEGYTRPYSFQLVAFDPFAYDVAAVSTPLGPGGGNVTNPGNIYTKPKITIVQAGAGAANFTITNVTTGQVLVLDLTLNIARIIDVARSTLVKASDGTNQFSVRVSGFISNLFLVPGVNAIAFANTAGITSVTFDFRGAYA